MTLFDKLKNTINQKFDPNADYDEESLLTQADLTAGRLYYFVLMALIAVILTISTMTAWQIQIRHELYHRLAQEQVVHHELKTEEQRLIIEQQTFSSIAIVAKRATNELGMYYPIQKDRIIITPPDEAKPSP